MQCQNCGRPLLPADAVCPLCGSPVSTPGGDQLTDEMPARPRAGAFQVGTPEDPFANTTYEVFGGSQVGAPVAAPAPPLVLAAGAGPATRWPAPPTARGHPGRWLPLFAVCCAFCVVGALVAGALVASGQLAGGVMLGLGGVAPRASQAAHPTHPVGFPTATARARTLCPLAPVDSRAAQALANVQLATGVQSPQSDVPLDRVTTFHVGQTVYVAFELATNASGTLTGTICANGTLAAKALSVQAGQLHRRGEFNLATPLTAVQAGPGAVVLTWNGAVAATLPFAVSPH
ncbi:MAG TPA: hypothetical protein VGN32_14430 [Ktedonobacterales bacterium]|nr:hypothetical protein [Ktedonobacterales bacterium]